MKKTPALYIIMRNDLESMTPGKSMAQAAHAANMFDSKISSYPELEDVISQWKWDSSQGFGTTIVLQGNIKEIQDLYRSFSVYRNIPCGLVLDPSYPIKDGEVTHLIRLITCGYVFIQDRNDMRDPSLQMLQGLELHP